MSTLVVAALVEPLAWANAAEPEPAKPEPAKPTPTERAFRERLDARLAEADRADAAVIHGVVEAEDWLLLTAELRHYRAGKFWGDAAAAARAASQGPTVPAVQHPDPLPAVRDFAAQCRRAGVVLLLVPVPGKAALYPDRLGGGPWPAELGRPDVVDADWHRTLRDAGVEVLDLAPAFAELRRAGRDSHARTDSHWSPTAVRLTAGLIAEWLRKQADRPEATALAATLAGPKPTVKRTAWTDTVSGDLAGLLPPTPGQSRPRETLSGERVDLADQPVSPDRQSPIVLLGDSHVLVYHEPIAGGLEIRGSGLPDLLAAELGRAPDVVAVLGSGAVAPRLSLARRRDNLAGKAAVIWCFSVREWTQAPQGWPPIPVVK